MAGYGVKLWPILQDLGQLKRHYKESWETFLGNAGVLQFFANADLTTLDWLSKRMTDTLYGWIAEGGIIRSGEGEEIEIYPGIVDDAHGEDGSGSWISQQCKRVSSPPRRRPRQSMLLRLQIYDAAFRIATGDSIVPEKTA